MKKITNNAMWGKIAILLNFLIIISFVLSMFFLMKFDEVNTQLVDIKPTYESATVKMHDVRQPMRKDSAAVAFYSTKLDSLKTVVPQNAAEKKVVADELKRVSGILKDEITNKEKTDSIVEATETEYLPIKTKYDEISLTTEEKSNSFSIWAYITFFLLLGKILIFAYWNYKNSKNLHQIANWMKNGHAPYWSFLGWFIPAYNLIKPYNVFSEIMNESQYILTEKAELPKKEHDNTEFFLGIWWTMVLLALVICSFILYSTFFTEGPMYWKLNHLSVVVVAIIIWVIYLLIDIVMILKYNKLNKLMMDNESKFLH